MVQRCEEIINNEPFQDYQCTANAVGEFNKMWFCERHYPRLTNLTHSGWMKREWNQYVRRALEEKYCSRFTNEQLEQMIKEQP